MGGPTRRQLLTLPAAALLTAAAAAPAVALQGELAARPPATPPSGPAKPGMQRLGDLGVVYIPPGLTAEGPVPLILALHGAGQGGAAMAGMLTGLADALGIVILAPDSAGRTWDWLNPTRQQSGSRVQPGSGPDVGRIDRALERTFALLPVDVKSVALLGFSDGATFGLDLGIRNPELFSRLFIVAPSTIPKVVRGPGAEIYITHGRADRVLPEKATADYTVPALRRRGFAVTYEPFDGGHSVPLPLLHKALAAWLGGR